MRPHGSAERLEARRLKAVEMLNSGRGYHEVARILKTAISSLVRWMQAYRRAGKKGLRPRPTPGRPPRLSRQQKKALARLLLRGAVAAGYENELWTLPRIAEQIRRHFGVRYHTAHIGKLLRGMGWSCQKPERRAPQRDEEAIEQWKRQDWPHRKKRGTTWRPLGLPRRERVSGHPACA